MDAGIKVGVYPSMENVTFNFVFDEYDWGYTEGEEAAKWIDEKMCIRDSRYASLSS